MWLPAIGSLVTLAAFGLGQSGRRPLDTARHCPDGSGRGRVGGLDGGVDGRPSAACWPTWPPRCSRRCTWLFRSVRLVAIREAEGPPALFLLMLTIIVSDTAQYYTGRLTGRTPLAPSISPKKTLEGAIGGFVFGTLVFTLVGAWWLARMPIALRVLARPHACRVRDRRRSVRIAAEAERERQRQLVDHSRTRRRARPPRRAALRGAGVLRCAAIRVILEPSAISHQRISRAGQQSTVDSRQSTDVFEASWTFSADG